jgi:demethylmenaquinone methyltransferase/2-methoxy-6-polyprenyl-1,4-benzoquinol methylase
MDASLQNLLEEQRRYYGARAGEYEDWWHRQGRYDHGAEANRAWFADVAQAQGALDRFAPAGEILELACGTGLWTARLAPRAARLTAVDASAEVLALAREKVAASNVEYVQADLFTWEPEHEYDVCFFGFWLSHVPSELLDAFLAKVARALAPDGRVFIVDSAGSPRATARDHDPGERGDQISRRRLADGSEYTIVKHWFEAGALQATLEAHGWDASIAATDEFFVYGSATPRASAAGSPSGV